MAVSQNADGLRYRYGLDVQKAGMVGATCSYGPVSTIVAKFEFGRDNSLSGGLIGGEQNAMIPSGSWIKSASFIVTETFTSGGAATLDLGLGTYDANGALSYTNLDEDGIDVALAVASLAAGAVIACDGALVGAGASGKLTAANGYLSYDIDTAVFTAGKALLVVEYVAPMYPDQGTD